MAELEREIERSRLRLSGQTWGITPYGLQLVTDRPGPRPDPGQVLPW